MPLPPSISFFLERWRSPGTFCNNLRSMQLPPTETSLVEQIVLADESNQLITSISINGTTGGDVTKLDSRSGLESSRTEDICIFGHQRLQPIIIQLQRPHFQSTMICPFSCRIRGDCGSSIGYRWLVWIQLFRKFDSGTGRCG